MINKNEYWNASPLRLKSGSNTLLHCVFSIYRLLALKSLCLWGYLPRRGFWCIYVCSCNRSKSAKKKRRAPLTQKETAHAYSCCLSFNKIGCFKTAVLKNAWPCYRCSPSFRNELLVLHLFLSPVHAPWWAAYKDRSHSNDEKILPETMYFATPRYKR